MFGVLRLQGSWAVGFSVSEFGALGFFFGFRPVLEFGALGFFWGFRSVLEFGALGVYSFSVSGRGGLWFLAKGFGFLAFLFSDCDRGNFKLFGLIYIYIYLFIYNIYIYKLYLRKFELFGPGC